MITEKQAYRIVEEFKNELISVLSDQLLAMYLIGSLGGGYYRPGQSDIDTVLIVSDDVSVTQEQVEKIAEKYQIEYSVPKGFGAVMIMESELFPPYRKSEIEEFEFSVEIARLKVQGKLFYGSYSLEQVPMPTKQHLIKDAKIMEHWFDTAFGYPMFDRLNTVSCVNCILGIMRRKLMIEDGVFEFNKFNTIAVYSEHRPDVSDDNIFSIIKGYLNGVDISEKDLEELRSFGIRISDHYNQKLLGMIR